MAQIRVYQGKVEAAPLRETQVIELTRNYDVSRSNYQQLLDKTFSAEMATDLEQKQKAERFTVLDPARPPEHPYKPKRLPMMLGAIIMSLCTCIGLAIAKDTVNVSIKTENELKALLPAHVSLLAAIPSIDTAEERRRRAFQLAVTGGFVLLACLAEVAFLWKVHPHL